MTPSIGKSGQSTGQIIAAVTLTVDPHSGLSEGLASLCLLRPSCPEALVLLHTHQRDKRTYGRPGALALYHVVLKGEHNGFYMDDSVLAQRGRLRQKRMAIACSEAVLRLSCPSR